MSSIDWAGYRFNKKIQASAEEAYEAYPATLSIIGLDINDEAQQFAEFVNFLKETGRIADYNQVALLMYSVKTYKSDAYVRALQEKGIPVFCPRAGTYFDQDEVRLMVGCLRRVFNYTGGLLHEIVGHFGIYQYLNDCFKMLANRCDTSTALETILEEYAAEIAQLTEGQTVNRCLADYFYSLLACEPFTIFLKDENKLQNLVIFSQILETFQNYYHFEHISNENSENLVSCFFNRFLCLLYEDGMNQFENPEQPFPPGHVLVMTIHQAKGLEFPVVVVGSLDRNMPEPEEIDSKLRRFYPRPQPEPETRIPLFDFMRLYYVAFSRAKNLLVLTGNQRRRISPHFNEIMRGLPQWGYAQSDLLSIKTFEPAERSVFKPRYSFTSHINMYETCPRQYQFFREYKFIPSRSADTFVGLLVHQTIERIHRIVLDGQMLSITQERLRELFEQTYYFLSQVNMRPLDERDKEKAFKQVEDYFYNNQFEMYDVEKAEEQIAIMKGEYFLTGRLDVVIKRNGKREIWDLKTTRRPEPESLYLEQYERQLYMYAHALEKRDMRPERLVLYWTEEPLREDALMVFYYEPEKVQIAVTRFEYIVEQIKKKNFEVVTVPEDHICNKCDMRNLCTREGLIKR